jgi:hypothetical protein
MQRFVLEFLGGCWNGKRLDSQSVDREEVLLAQVMYFLTGDGAVGKKIPGLSPEAIAFAARRGWHATDDAKPASATDYTVIEQHGETDRRVVILKHGVHYATAR